MTLYSTQVDRELTGIGGTVKSKVASISSSGCRPSRSGTDHRAGAHVDDARRQRGQR
jgi:hypothetical protein